MNRDVLVPLLKTVVLLDVVEVISSDDNGPFHLFALHNACQDAATDAYIPSEGALFVNVGAFSSLQCMHALIADPCDD